MGPGEEIKQELGYGKCSWRCADVASIGLKPPFYEDLQFLISQYFCGMRQKGAIKLSRDLMPSVMGRVIPRLIPYSSHTVFVSIRNGVQIISVFIQNCKCLSEHLNGFSWDSVLLLLLFPKVCIQLYSCHNSQTQVFIAQVPLQVLFQVSGFAWSVFHAGFLCMLLLRLCQ